MEAQAERNGTVLRFPECDLARTLNGVSSRSLRLGRSSRTATFILMPSLVRPDPLRNENADDRGGRVCNKTGCRTRRRSPAGGARQLRSPDPLSHPRPASGVGVLPKRLTHLTVVPAFGRTGRRNVIHLFKTLRPGQSRGCRTRSGDRAAEQLGRYTEARSWRPSYQACLRYSSSRRAAGGLSPGADHRGGGSDRMTISSSPRAS